jgi:anti-anti-sigma regulatory factor
MQTAETLADLLREAAGLSRSVVIDASAVERISTSAIQLLLAMDQAMAGSDEDLTLENPSAAFMAAFADCGIRQADMNWKLMSGVANG